MNRPAMEIKVWEQVREMEQELAAERGDSQYLRDQLGLHKDQVTYLRHKTAYYIGEARRYRRQWRSWANVAVAEADENIRLREALQSIANVSFIDDGDNLLKRYHRCNEIAREALDATTRIQADTSVNGG